MGLLLSINVTYMTEAPLASTHYNGFDLKFYFISSSIYIYITCLFCTAPSNLRNTLDFNDGAFTWGQCL
jgi:hypothetical protein